MSAGVTVLAKPESAVRLRLADYLALTKPRMGVMILFTAAAGAWLAAHGAPNPALLFHMLLGTALVVAGASTLNQVLERHTDSLMARTENRPLSSGRLVAAEGWIFGLILAMVGLGYLSLTLENRLAVLVAGFAFIAYVFVYTPLKRITSLNTLVGAVPGALPPVIGWTAVTGSFDAEAAVLFLIVFLWQVPHFLAIARIYRDDYARAGMPMLPVVDRQSAMTSRQMVGYCLVLIPASLMPVVLGQAGGIYLAGALLLGVGFLGTAVGFLRHRSVTWARRVLRASLVYLPALFALLLINGT
jgi:protoheme IX farnesyltransferase